MTLTLHLLFILTIIKVILNLYSSNQGPWNEQLTIKNEPYFILAKQWNSTAEHSKVLSICIIYKNGQNLEFALAPIKSRLAPQRYKYTAQQFLSQQ